MVAELFGGLEIVEKINLAQGVVNSQAQGVISLGQNAKACPPAAGSRVESGEGHCLKEPGRRIGLPRRAGHQ
jgi:hypothetical protein